MRYGIVVLFLAAMDKEVQRLSCGHDAMVRLASGGKTSKKTNAKYAD
jgi:hypothetical protein